MALLGRASLLGRPKLRPRQEGGGFSHAQTPRPCPLVWDFPWSGVPLHEGLPHPRETGGARAQAARRLNDDRHGSWRRERPPILLLADASLGCRRSGVCGKASVSGSRVPATDSSRAATAKAARARQAGQTVQGQFGSRLCGNARSHPTPAGARGLGEG